LQLSLYALLANKEDRDKLKEQLSLLGDIEDKEIQLITKSGMVRYCMLSLSKEIDNNGTPYFQGISHDISNLKKAEKEKLQLVKVGMAERVARTLAHEVRNPLNNINLAAEQLAAEINSDTAKIYIDIINRNSGRIGDLITELLKTSSPDISLRDNNLQEIIEESIAIANDRFILKHIKLITTYPAHVVNISADREKLKVAFLNLIINAVEAMQEGHGELIIDLAIHDGVPVLTIKDNGCGISEENISHLFEPYFTAKKNGMGLGLSTTLTVLQIHNATVEVLSKLNEGTSFIITFKQH
ncbi:MAG: PAS domain-containing sensor histidine kinase, partial [Sphingobacteriales bacterium]|nr:PAS domain-containing sensor histidine kinase [Sphingobacteriales bacterium]